MIIHFRGIYEIVQGGTKIMVQYLASLDWTITFVPPCISFFFSKTIYAMSEYGKFQEIGDKNDRSNPWSFSTFP